MSYSNNDIVAANRAQTISEVDTFTGERYRQFFRHLPRETKKILDVGCNTGRGGEVLKSYDTSLELTGLDCVPERLAVLKKDIYQHTLCCFSNDIPAERGSFDCVVAGEFIEHVPPTQIDDTLAEFFRILRLKGRVLMTTPNPNYLRNKLRKTSFLLDQSHVCQHYPDCLAQRLRMIGFANIRIVGSGRVSHYLGQRFPILAVYGSYLISADKW